MQESEILPTADDAAEPLKSRKVSERCKSSLYYGVEDIPPTFTTLLMAFQQVIVSISVVIAVPLVVASLICAEQNLLAQVMLIGTALCTAGFATIMQTTFGTRLPLLQGPGAEFLPPIIVLTRLPQYSCPFTNNTLTDFQNETIVTDNLWMERMQMIQGGLICASAVQMIIGATGVIGVISKFIGPLTIAPMMLLLAISLVNMIVDKIVKHWIGFILVVLLAVIALYLDRRKVPMPTCTKKAGCKLKPFPLFALFPFLIALSITWLLCIIFTESGWFKSTSAHFWARTDIKADVIREAPWFRIPYPFQWGTPKFVFPMFFGMISGTIACVIDSLGDYTACARVCQQPKPPSHAVNRGIFIEGFCSFIGGFFGGGSSFSTYAKNIGAIEITRVASRRVLQIAGAMMILLGICTKFAAVIASIPDPLIGGLWLFGIAIVGGVGISSLQAADLQVPRNSAILGLSIMLGLTIPRLIRESNFSSGWPEFDQVINVVLQTEMIVGAIIAFLLDNTVPGATKEQRGFKITENIFEDGTTENNNCYEFSPRTMNFIGKYQCILKYCPLIPKILETTDEFDLRMSEIATESKEIQ